MPPGEKEDDQDGRPARTSGSFCLEVACPDAQAAELAGAEAWAAGAEGIEEREEASGRTRLLVYAPASAVDGVRDALLAHAAGVPAARRPGIGDVAPVQSTDWSQAWREGLEAIRVGERLVVRPSWIESPLEPGQVELVIDPGQAFGTGGHVSTRLALDWLEEIARGGAESAAGLAPGDRVLDVGTGTGVLALAALALGAGTAVGLDLDPESGHAARHWARVNGLSARLAVFVGPLDALGASGFDWLVANLLKREMLPIAGPMAAALRAGGHAVFSGLLARERAEVETALAREGFVPVAARTSVDANGDEWISFLMQRG